MDSMKANYFPKAIAGSMIGILIAVSVFELLPFLPSMSGLTGVGIALVLLLIASLVIMAKNN